MIEKKTDSLLRTLPFQIKRADSFFIRFKGLMFRKEAIKNEGLWIIPCNSIHMFFMRFPIDVVFLDKQKQILKVVNNLQPWSMVFPVKGAHSVIELPVGTNEALSLEAGQYINI